LLQVWLQVSWHGRTRCREAGNSRATASHRGKAHDGKVTDFSARRVYRRYYHSGYRPYYRPYYGRYYYARPYSYRPYPYYGPAPFTFGFGFGPYW